jgi:tRNA A-37 threonylcarbamoyl transferase component Bud32/tetratricopeptide (TPR) repeat protein
MDDPLDRLTGALADRYRIERELGAGGMATVYLAEDLKHHRRVAVKVLRPELAAVLGTERFLREITIAANLQHPNIVPVYDSGEADGFLYYVMPYIEGPTLRARLVREAVLPVAEAVRILRDVAEGVAAAHAHGVVHRDIKPENIMLSGHHALVADFGVARAVSETTGRHAQTSAGVALGTPGYRAPEQDVGDPLADHRADIYALGVVAYEVLAGEPPLEWLTPQAPFAAQVTRTPAPLAERRPTVPPPLASLVMRCMAKEPADRPKRVEEILAVLESLATPPGGFTPVETRPVAPTTRAWPRGWLERPGRPAAAGAAIAAVLLLVLAGAGVWTSRTRSPALPGLQVREPVVVLPFEVQASDAALMHVGVQAADRIAAAIEGASLAHVVRYRPENGGAAYTERLGRRVVIETGAGTLVTGTIAQRGERVEVQARVIRAADLRTVWTLGPDAATAADPTPALDRVRERVLGAVGSYLSVYTRQWRNLSASQPPTSLEAYRLMEKAHELFRAGSFTEAIPFFREAYVKDTTFLVPVLILGHAFYNLDQWQLRDSVHAFIQARRERLFPLDALLFDRFSAEVLSPEAQVKASLALAAAEPAHAYGAMRSLVWARRPAAALEYHARRDTAFASVREWQYWDELAARAYHMMGRFEEELALVRAAKTREPRHFGHWTREVSALAALGRVAEIDQLITESHGLETPGASVRLLATAAIELARHDRGAQARAYAERALTAEAQLPDSARASGVEGNLRHDAMRILGRHAEIVQELESWQRTAGPGSLSYRVLAARDRILSGDTVGARALADSARSQPIEAFAASGWGKPGQPMYYGAQILALLGRRDEAVALLREALNNGRRLGPDEPLEWYWTPIRDYPPFHELVRIR